MDDPSISPARRFAGGWLFAICAVLAGCGDETRVVALVSLNAPPSVPACLQNLVQPGELAASPRPDRIVETLAQRLSTGLTADQAIYARLSRDRDGIAAGWPEVARAFHFARTYTEEIILGTTPVTADAMLAGTYADWNCLNGGLSASGARPFSAGVILTFSGPLLALDRVAKLYATLPGVRYADPNYIVSFVSLSRADTGVTPAGEIWHYVLWQQPGMCTGCAPEGYYYFTSFAGGGVTFVDSWPGTSGPEPVWFDPYWRKAQSRRVQ